MSIKYNEFGEVISVNGLTTGQHLGAPMQDAKAEKPEDNQAYATQLNTVGRVENCIEDAQPAPVGGGGNGGGSNASGYVMRLSKSEITDDGGGDYFNGYYVSADAKELVDALQSNGHATIIFPNDFSSEIPYPLAVNVIGWIYIEVDGRKGLIVRTIDPQQIMTSQSGSINTVQITFLNIG